MPHFDCSQVLHFAVRAVHAPSTIGGRRHGAQDAESFRDVRGNVREHVRSVLIRAEEAELARRRDRFVGHDGEDRAVHHVQSDAQQRVLRNVRRDDGRRFEALELFDEGSAHFARHGRRVVVGQEFRDFEGVDGGGDWRSAGDVDLSFPPVVVDLCWILLLLLLLIRTDSSSGCNCCCCVLIVRIRFRRKGRGRRKRRR